mmetsp:Transcript_5452/g.20376  ORF Transcript_5452/g.20376 Transcript_5452/m.20376 type:complete len:226 (-) Transcript_5452:1318-1995(-)
MCSMCSLFSSITSKPPISQSCITPRRPLHSPSTRCPSHQISPGLLSSCTSGMPLQQRQTNVSAFLAASSPQPLFACPRIVTTLNHLFLHAPNSFPQMLPTFQCDTFSTPSRMLFSDCRTHRSLQRFSSCTTHPNPICCWKIGSFPHSSTVIQLPNNCPMLVLSTPLLSVTFSKSQCCLQTLHLMSSCMDSLDPGSKHSAQYLPIPSQPGYISLNEVEYFRSNCPH